MMRLHKAYHRTASLLSLSLSVPALSPPPTTHSFLSLTPPVILRLRPVRNAVRSFKTTAAAMTASRLRNLGPVNAVAGEDSNGAASSSTTASPTENEGNLE
jgi:hypothetical protein